MKFALHLSLLFAVGAAGFDPAVQAQTVVLTDTQQNIHEETWSYQGDGWSVRKDILRGGRQEGVDRMIIDNGVMRIVVLPTRGMSIYEVRSGDLRLGWDSPSSEIVHPSLIDLESRGGLGWLEGFNEWMVRCGLEFAGHPGEDSFVTNTGDTATMNLTLHGRIGNLPASRVEVILPEKEGDPIRVRGVVPETMFNGPRLQLTAEVSVVPGASKFQIRDEVANLGGGQQEFQIIYHANFGPPLLGENSVVHAAVDAIAPMNEHAARGIDGAFVYGPPTAGFVEQVYLCRPRADAEGQTSAVLVNSDQSLAASLSWSVKELPCLTIWKNTADLKDGYVTGIEPATGYPYNRQVERAAGRVPVLPPGATRSFVLDVELHTTSVSVSDAMEHVRTLQGNQPMELTKTPPNEP